MPNLDGMTRDAILVPVLQTNPRYKGGLFSMKKLPAIVNNDFRVLVVPTNDVRMSDCTIPQSYTANGIIRAVASAEGSAVGCSWWAMKSPAKVSKALRALADFIDKIDAEEKESN